MTTSIPHPVQALVDDLKRINTGALILAKRLDGLVLVELRQARRYDLSALSQAAHRGLKINNLIFSPTCDHNEFWYFWIDLNKIAHESLA